MREVTSSGPVHLIVADDGRMGLVCSVDDQSWDLPNATPVSSEVVAVNNEAVAPGHPRRMRALERELVDNEFAAKVAGRPKSPVERFARAYFK